MLNNKRLLNITVERVIGAGLNLIVAECDTVEAAEVENTGGESTEGIALDYKILVITALLLLRNTAVVSDVSITPALATIQAVVEHIVANLDIANARLLIPI